MNELIERTFQLSRRAFLSFDNGGDIRADYVAYSKWHQNACVNVRYAVAQAGKMSGLWVEIRDCANASSAVPYPETNFIAVLRRTFLRQYVDGKGCVVALYFKNDCVSVTGGYNIGYIPVCRDFLAVYGNNNILGVRMPASYAGFLIPSAVSKAVMSTTITPSV